MDCVEFLSATICSMDGAPMCQLKKMLSDLRIAFSFVEDEDVDARILAEKLSDYFKMVGLKTFRSFEDCVSAYMDGLNTIVEPWILGTSQVSVVPRARKYYERFAEMRLRRDRTIDDVVDYSRIMLCLYESILENGVEPIDDFDYDRDALDPVVIVEAMRSEEGRGLFRRQGSRLFDTNETYEMGTCIIVIAMIMLFTLTSVQCDT